MRVQGLRRKFYVIPDREFDPLEVKMVSESQKCAQSVLSRNERHKFPDGFRLKFLFRMFIVVINEEEILRLIF